MVNTKTCAKFWHQKSSEAINEYDNNTNGHNSNKNCNDNNNNDNNYSNTDNKQY